MEFYTGLQGTVIAALFLAVFSAGIVQEESDQLTPWLGGWLAPDAVAGRVICLAGGLALLYFVFCRLTTRYVLSCMGSQSSGHSRIPNIIFAWQRRLLLLFYVAIVTAGGWARLIIRQWDLSGWIGLWEVAMIAPFVILMVIYWAGYYPVHRVLRERLMLDHLIQGYAARPAGTASEYLLFNLRHGLLAILVPALLIFTWHDSLMRLVPPENLTPQQDMMLFIATLLGAGVIFLLSPVVLRYVWAVKRLPDGPLREKMSGLAARLAIRYRELLVWESHGSMVNAAVMGLVGPFRYVLLSDALIENLEDEQIAAVFRHEAGHIRHRHGLFVMMGMVGGLLLLAILLDFILKHISAWSSQTLVSDDALLLIGGGILLGVAIPLIGVVMSLFERQADYYSAFGQANNSSESPDDRTEEQSLEADRVTVLCQALRRIAMLNGMSLRSRVWGYGSVLDRIQFLRHLSHRPEAQQKFQRKIIVVKTGIIVLLTTSLLLVSWFSAHATQVSG